jgi:Flp pilus assembly pilin Flp
MALFYSLVHPLWHDRRGQDLVEYALLVGFVGVAGGVFFPTQLMPEISVIFSKVNDLFIQAAAQGS